MTRSLEYKIFTEEEGRVKCGLARLRYFFRLSEHSRTASIQCVFENKVKEVIPFMIPLQLMCDQLHPLLTDT